MIAKTFLAVSAGGEPFCWSGSVVILTSEFSSAGLSPDASRRFGPGKVTPGL